MSSLQTVLERSLELSQKLGAQGAFVSCHQSRNHSVTWRDGRIDTLKSSTQLGLTLMLYVDGRFSAHSSNDLNLSLEDFIAKSIALTRLLEPDPCYALPDPKRYEARSAVDLQILDPQILDLDNAYLSQRCADAEKACQECVSQSPFPVTEISCLANTLHTESYSASSNGFFGKRESCAFRQGSYITLQDDSGKKPVDYDSFNVRALDDAKSPESLAQEAFRLAKLHCNPKKLPSKRCSIVLHNRIVPKLLEPFLSPLSGSHLNSKRSYFLDKLDQPFASALLNLKDLPLLPKGLASRHFDNEGCSCHDAELFSQGRPQRYLLNTYYANKLQLPPTHGNYSNLLLPPGDKSLDAMIADIQEGILVLSFVGGNFDPLRGDFSYGIVGQAIQNGQLTQAVSEMNISGNFTKFWFNLSQVANDVYPYSAILSPSLRIDEVSVSGL